MRIRQTLKKAGLVCALLCGAIAGRSEIMFSYYDQYANLYPDCVDDEPSKVYSLDTPGLTEPEFPGGGRVQMTRFVHFSTEILDVKGPDGEQLKGKVLIKMTVDRCGVAKDFEIIQSLSDEQDAEALRVLESFPIMKPGAIDGTRVKVAMEVPVYFTRTYVEKKKSYIYDGEEYFYDDSYDYDSDDYEYDDYEYYDDSDYYDY